MNIWIFSRTIWIINNLCKFQFFAFIKYPSKMNINTYWPPPTPCGSCPQWWWRPEPSWSSCCSGCSSQVSTLLTLQMTLTILFVWCLRWKWRHYHLSVPPPSCPPPSRPGEAACPEISWKFLKCSWSRPMNTCQITDEMCTPTNRNKTHILREST